MQLKEIDLFLPWTLGTGVDVAKGLYRFARQRSGWQIRRHESDPAAIARAGERRPGGAIGKFNGNEAMLAAAEALPCPVVNIHGGGMETALPQVGTSNRAIGRLAAEHLLAAGYERFAYVGVPSLPYSQRRKQAFAETLREAGHEVLEFAYDAEPAPTQRRFQQSPDPKLAAWLERQRKPLGIFAMTDTRAFAILQLCPALGIHVPGDIGLIGADDNPFVQAGSSVPLTSVRPNREREGHLAARKLAALMDGREIEPRIERIEPEGVEARRSTDLLGERYPEMARARRILTSAATEGIDIGTVAQLCGMSRRKLERRYRQVFGRSPYAEALRLRHARARNILEQTDLPIAEVARHVGYSSDLYLIRDFKKREGIPPGEYRTRLTQP